jgi:beta-lactamase superfamily II metal-dependent hydrolase
VDWPRSGLATNLVAGFDFDGAPGNFLWPQITRSEVAPTAKNDDSLVFRVAFGQRSFLLPGNAEKMSEHNIHAESTPEALRSDVLNNVPPRQQEFHDA